MVRDAYPTLVLKLATIFLKTHRQIQRASVDR